MNSIGQSSIDAEQAVLGAVLIDNDVLDEIIDLLEPRDFLGVNQLVWKGVKYLYKQNKPVDIVTLTELIKQANRNDISIAYIAELANAVPTTSNAVHYAKIVRSSALHRRGIEAGQKIIQLTEESGFESDEDYFSAIEQVISKLRPQENGSVMRFGDLKDRYIAYLKTKDDLVLTGFPKFDQWMGGVGRGWLYIIAARPSTGKTAKMLEVAWNIAEQNAGQVIVFSLEMVKEQLLNRIIAARTHLNGNRIRRKEIDGKELDKIGSVYENYQSLPLHIDDTPVVTMDYIKSTCRRIQRQYGPIAAVFVDYLQLMKIQQEKNQTRSQAIGTITRGAKLLAKELNAPFFLLSQLNREVEKRAGKKPMLADLRESGEIEQDADIVEFLWINEEEKDPNGTVIQSYIAKGRDIGVNDFKYLFKPWYQTYQEL